ncbi:MAG: YdeI/OmpD-associated family protein [Candidatus Aminicenantales bacterium]
MSRNTMPSKTSKPFKTVETRTIAQWRAWLAEHHDSESEVWLIFKKRHTGLPVIDYEDAVNEALCFGWIDSAKRDETKKKRLQEAIRLLAAGKKLGLK